MNEMEQILQQIPQLDLDEYRKIIAYCERRSAPLEGIPAIIGLDDLTRKEKNVYQGAQMDAQMNAEMARDAMVFSWLYDEVSERDPHYPAIAPAMSALAEKAFFTPEGENQPCQYRQLVGMTTAAPDKNGKDA